SAPTLWSSKFPFFIVLVAAVSSFGLQKMPRVESRAASSRTTMRSRLQSRWIVIDRKASADRKGESYGFHFHAGTGHRHAETFRYSGSADQPTGRLIPVLIRTARTAQSSPALQLRPAREGSPSSMTSKVNMPPVFRQNRIGKA